MNESTKLYNFGTYKQHKATNEEVLTLQLYVNFCSPEAAAKLSTSCTLWQLSLLFNLNFILPFVPQTM